MFYVYKHLDFFRKDVYDQFHFFECQNVGWLGWALGHFGTFPQIWLPSEASWLDKTVRQPWNIFEPV